MKTLGTLERPVSLESSFLSAKPRGTLSSSTASYEAPMVSRSSLAFFENGEKDHAKTTTGAEAMSSLSSAATSSSS